MPVAQTRRNDEIRDLATAHLIVGVPERPLGGGVELEDPTPVVDSDDAIERRVQNRGVPCFALAHRFSCAAAICELTDLAPERLHRREQLVVWRAQVMREELDRA
jgi:hypothetical protein